MVVRIEVTLELVGRQVPPEFRQRLTGAAAAERRGVDIGSVELVHEMVPHVAGIEDYFTWQLPLEEEIPRLHIAALELARSDGAHRDIRRRSDLAGRYVRALQQRDALGERR